VEDWAARKDAVRANDANNFIGNFFFEACCFEFTVYSWLPPLFEISAL
jgi:hypothetical protein